METHPYEQFPFAKLSKQFSKEQITLKPKQISHRWRNILDPRLSKESLSDKEKYYITSWVETQQKTRTIIQWSELQTEMAKCGKCGKFRSRNELKNFWFSKKRSEIKRRNNYKAEISYILNR
ncbi:6489_t:CDS:2 [Funneliformis geosporum]|uniref:6489_t:CDS:1 n=1 Tax=Funneliformis geosporum TaxID=1117311 RepID=A0A9W4SD36_9GLOM|nr:6489_t:CDS:2 [Funneliformis geosporum]